jgi:hypothetical protein
VQPLGDITTLISRVLLQPQSASHFAVSPSVPRAFLVPAFQALSTLSSLKMQYTILSLFFAACTSAQASVAQMPDAQVQTLPQPNVVQIGDSQIQVPATVPTQQQYPAQAMGTPQVSGVVGASPGSWPVVGGNASPGSGPGLDFGSVSAPGPSPGSTYVSGPVSFGSTDSYGQSIVTSVSPNTMVSPFVAGTSPAYGSLYPAGHPETAATGFPGAGGSTGATTGGGAGTSSGEILISTDGEPIAVEPVSGQSSLPVVFEGAASKRSDGWGLIVLAMTAGIVAVGMM